MDLKLWKIWTKG